MARPRVFISSTFYDLKFARSELERFIKEMGYEPVMNERGHIPYGPGEALERYCYNEISKVNILISIIGGRFGSQSRDVEHQSISNMELETALKQKKQVYIFVDAGVHSEYQTYKKNKSLETIQYTHVDDVRIYQFIEKIYALPFNNQIASFDGMPFIISYLKDQWSGLFEQYLQQQSQAQILDMMEKMEATTTTLRDLVELFKNTQQNSQSSVAVKEQAFDALILQNHPLFSRIAKITRTSYRVFFTSINEMEAWLTVAKRGKPVDSIVWDDETHMEYFFYLGSTRRLLKVACVLFNETGDLKPMLPGEWEESMLSSRSLPEPTNQDNSDDDIPF